MSCTAADYVFLALLGLCIVIALVTTWWQSSLLKLLELRHRAVYAVLGRPRPEQLADSIQHATAMLRFLLGDEYKRLKDEQVDLHVRVLLRCHALGLLAFVALVVTVVAAPSAEAVLGFHCWSAS